MSLTMAGIFVVSLTVPEAWHDMPGGLDGPLVFVTAFLLVRCIQVATYQAVLRGDAVLRRVNLIAFGPVLAGGALLIMGALIGGSWQNVLFTDAIGVDWGGIYVKTRSRVSRTSAASSHPHSESQNPNRETSAQPACRC